MSMRNLSEIGIQTGTDKATYHEFCPFYQAYLPKQVNSVLEFGVLRGDSLKMWQKYYPSARVEGVDINENDIDFLTYVADQDDIESLQKLRTKLVHRSTDSFDLIIDDGGHTMKQQYNTLLMFLDLAKYYIIEDLHTSFYPEYGDGSMLKLVMEGLPGMRNLIKDISIFTRIHQNGERSITAIIKTIHA